MPNRRGASIRRRLGDRGRSSRVLFSTLSVVVFLVLWELLPRMNAVDPQYVSQPSRVLRAAADIYLHGHFLQHVQVSAVELFVGFGFALVLGVLLGIAIGVSKRMRYLLDPPIMALWSTPRLALIPILIVWFGIGVESKIVVVFLGAVIPIIVNTVVGIREVDYTLVRAARSFCARRRDIFLRVLLPGAIPAILTGVRLGFGRGLMGMVAGEMYVSTKGIGNQIMYYGENYRISHLLVYVCFVCLFGFAANNLVTQLESRLRSWKVT